MQEKQLIQRDMQILVSVNAELPNDEFNAVIADSNDRLYLAHIEGDSTVWISHGAVTMAVPLSESTPESLQAASVKEVLEWFSRIYPEDYMGFVPEEGVNFPWQEKVNIDGLPRLMRIAAAI